MHCNAIPFLQALWFLFASVYISSNFISRNKPPCSCHSEDVSKLNLYVAVPNIYIYIVLSLSVGFEPRKNKALSILKLSPLWALWDVQLASCLVGDSPVIKHGWEKLSSWVIVETIRVIFQHSMFDYWSKNSVILSVTIYLPSGIFSLLPSVTTIFGFFLRNFPHFSSSIHPWIFQDPRTRPRGMIFRHGTMLESSSTTVFATTSGDQVGGGGLGMTGSSS